MSKLKMVRIIQEMHNHQWAITVPAFRAILSVLDGIELSEDDIKHFHSVDAVQKERMFSSFGRRVEGSLYSSIDGDVGYLMIDGPIIPRATWMSEASGLVSLDVLSSEFISMRDNPGISTIAQMLDTPGGAITGVSDYSALVKACEKKTVSWAWCAASAGYDIAAAADQIVSPSSGETGSVGVVCSLTDRKKSDEKRGIRHVEIVSSQSPDKRPDDETPEGRSVYQKIVDDLASDFVSRVAENRGVDEEHVLEHFGKGSIVVAKRALAAGMIDKIQDLHEFKSSLKQSGGFGDSINLSAMAEDDTPKEGKDMDKEKLKAEHPDLFNEISEDARAEERERIQGIEALAGKLKNPLPAVKAAVVAAIDGAKFDPATTAESFGGELLEVVTGAQAKAMEDVAEPRRQAAENASHVSTAAPKEAEGNLDPEAMDQPRVDKMLAISKEEGRIK